MCWKNAEGCKGSCFLFKKKKKNLFIFRQWRVSVHRVCLMKRDVKESKSAARTAARDEIGENK